MRGEGILNSGAKGRSLLGGICAVWRIAKRCGQKHRRAQGIQLNHVCSALNIDEKVAPVNDACCDADRVDACNGGGGAGVPANVS